MGNLGKALKIGEQEIQSIETAYMLGNIAAGTFRMAMAKYGYDCHWCDDRLDQLDEVRYLKK